MIISNFIAHVKLLNETEGLLVEVCSFIETWFSDELRPQNQTSLLLPHP